MVRIENEDCEVSPPITIQSEPPEHEVDRLGKIGLYAESVLKNEDPVFIQLRQAGYEPGAPCSITILSKVDNMNYYGAEGSLELLSEIQRRGGWSETQPLSIIDVGAGHGGTCRVMIQNLPVGSKVTAIELMQSVNRAASILTEMAEKSGEIQSGAIKHICADAVTGETFSKENEGHPHTLPKDGVAHSIVCRLCALHMPSLSRPVLLVRMKNWLRKGGVIAFEDYADGGLSPWAKLSLEKDVAVPDGCLPTKCEWRKMIKEAGFVDVCIEDVTAHWAKFVADRVGIAEADPKATDAMFGGPERREFYRAVAKLFNPPENDPSGLLGIRIYARVPDAMNN